MGRPLIRRFAGGAVILMALLGPPACRDRHPGRKVGAGADPRSRATAALFAACRKGDLAGIRASLKEGADRRALQDGRTALFAAIDSGDPEAVELLLETDPGLIGIPDPYSIRPLGYVVRGYGDFESRGGPGAAARLRVIDRLLAAGADLEAPDGYGHGMSEIFFAGGLSAPEVVESLLQHGAEVNRTLKTDYADSFCDNDFLLPAGSTPLDRYQALLQAVVRVPETEEWQRLIGSVIGVLKRHGAVNGAWAKTRPEG